MENERLIPRFEKHIWCFSPGEQLRTALMYMREEDFSQVVVQVNGKLRLLTGEGIARWLADRARQHEAIDLGRATVGEALLLESGELPNVEVMPSQASVSQAARLFKDGIERGEPRLYAIVITANGRDDETPLGIVTPWDLLGSQTEEEAP
jgi:CBS domain-containing protein